MLRNIVFIFCVSIFLTSCSGEDGVTFNDGLIASVESVTPILEDADEKFSTYAENNQVDSTVKLVVSIEKFIDSITTKLKKEPLPTSLISADEFKKAMINYLEKTKSIYSYYKYIVEEKDPKRKAEYTESLMKLEDSKKQWLTYVENAQNDFARRNGFKVQPSFPTMDFNKYKSNKKGY
jgi:hypothetical protein